MPSGLFKKANESDEAYKRRLTDLWLKVRKGEMPDGYSSRSLTQIPESFIYKKARELILSDIVEARKKLNLPIVLEGTFKSRKSMSLEKVGDVYFEQRGKPFSGGYKKDGLKYWKEFRKTVKVKSIGDLEESHIVSYEKWIFSSAKKLEWSNSTINNRLLLVATVFNQVFKNRRGVSSSDKEYLKTVIGFCTFRYQDKPEYDPCPISKEDYLNIYMNTRTRSPIVSNSETS